MLIDRLRDMCATAEMTGRTATERERWHPEHDLLAEASETAMRYETVLLDIDGTIADSNDAHAHAWMDALAQHGHPVEFHRIRPLIGMGGDKLLPRVAGVESESPEGRRISETRATIFASQYLPSVKPTPGARRFVEWLNKVGVTITIATSAKAQEVTGLLSAAGVDDLIAHAATSDDADASKPDPDIVVAALKKSGSERDKAIMIGDTPYDIEAATRAGVQTIAFRTGGWPDGALRGAVAIFNDPDDLVSHLADSPFAGPAT